MTKVVAMGEREAGACPACSGFVSVSAGHGHRAGHLPGYCLLAVLACATVQAEEGVPSGSGASDWERPATAASRQAPPAQSLERPPVMIGDADDDAPRPPQSARASYVEPVADEPAPGPVVADRGRDPAPGVSRLLLHVDDVTSANDIPESSRARALALALDAVVPNAGGLTIQPRVQMAYQPAAVDASRLAAGDFPGDTSSTSVGVRLYGAQPTRLAGVYPFVEADWWQDSRNKTININGTKIDTDLLRGLFSFNIGAHSSTSTGTKLWFKVRAGHNPGATVGARYKW